MIISSNGTKKSKQDEVDILPEHYYRDVAPMVDGKPVKVTISIIVLNIKLSSGSTQVSFLSCLQSKSDYHFTRTLTQMSFTTATGRTLVCRSLAKRMPSPRESTYLPRNPYLSTN